MLHSMNRLSPTLLDQALRLVAERLAALEAPVETLVVCGGSALLALGLVNRTTKGRTCLPESMPSTA